MSTEDKIVSYRRLFGRFATGVAVVLAEDGNNVVGLTVNSLTSVSLNPLLLLFCARNESESAATVLRVGRFSVNVLTAHQEAIARHFAGPRTTTTKFNCQRSEGFVSIPASAAVFRCTVEGVHLGGDHRIIIGRVIDMIGPDECNPPLLYHQGRYTQLELDMEEKFLAGTEQR